MTFKRRAGLLITLCVVLAPLAGGWAGDKKAGDKNAFYVGKVVWLADVLAKQGVKIDNDQTVLVLQTDDGKIYPLVKDEGSRMFFKDAKLLGRPMRLTARLIPNSQFQQVIQVHSLINGKLHDVYYWCDICTIKRYEAGICDCCGDKMEFREPMLKE